MTTTSCPQCGAKFEAGDTACIDRFNATQLKEVENPATYYSVHHISVPCYMLQHNAYSRRGWIEVYRLLHRFVYEDLNPQEARRQMRQEMNSAQRTWSLTRGEKLPGVERISWSRTIADVRIDTAEQYIDDVRRWAAAVLRDAEELVGG